MSSRRKGTASAASLLLGIAAVALAPGASAAAPAAPAAAGAGTLDIAQYRGKVVYLDFWASWCVPCRDSFPWMQEMARTYGPAGLVIIAVNVDEKRADAEAFLRANGALGIQIVYDRQGALAQRFGVVGMPSSFMVDRSGAVHAHHTGFRTKDRPTLESGIRELVATPVP